MKNLFLIALFAGFTNCALYAQSGPMPMAADTVLLVLKLVNADKKEDFEKFLQEIFLAGTAKLNPADQQLFKQMRILDPVKIQSDGTYSYFFLVKNPVIEDGDYYIKFWLTKMYGVDKAAEYMKRFSDDIAFGDIQRFVETRAKE